VRGRGGWIYCLSLSSEVVVPAKWGAAQKAHFLAGRKQWTELISLRGASSRQSRAEEGSFPCRAEVVDKELPKLRMYTRGGGNEKGRGRSSMEEQADEILLLLYNAFYSLNS
jgi:hypothetical protein